MKLRLVSSLLLFSIFGFSYSFASVNSIVMLKSGIIPEQFRAAITDTHLIRYQKAMSYQKYLQINLLEKFVADHQLKNSAEYLPIVAGIGMNLTSAEKKALAKDERVLKIIPNTPVYLDLPVLKDNSGTWGKGGDNGPDKPTGNYNSSLTLHQVDELIKEEGIDINKPGKIVGVVDTGVDGMHPALKDKVAAFINVSSGSKIPKDSQTHGTHVCGIIAGSEIDGLQIGVYPGAKLVVAASLDEGVAGMLKGWQWMMNPDGDVKTQDQPFVVNNSWHIGDADPAPFYKAIEAFKAADILLAFSAGNAGKQGITKPKEHPLTFTSAAVNANGVIADFSSWGPALYNGQKIEKPEVATMGVDVYSTLPNGRYGKMSGTSMASPFTTGAVALLGTYFPDKSPYLIADILKNTTQMSFTSLFDGMWNKQMGYGLLDVHAAFLKLKETNIRMLE